MSERKKTMKRVCSEFAWFILSAIAMLLAAPSASYADNMVGTVIVNQNAQENYCPGATSCAGFTTNNFGTATSMVSYSYSGSSASSVSGSGVSAASSGGPSSTGSVSLDYQMEVVPIVPVITGLVPVIFLAEASTNATGAGADAYANVLFAAEPEAVICTASGVSAEFNPRCGIGAYVNDLILYDVMLNAGSVYEIVIQVNGEATPSSGLGAGTWSASIDPMVYIDPTFQYAADYTLEVSPVPASSTPEPSTSLLLGTGLLLCFGAGIYKRLHTKPGRARALK